MPPYQWTTDDDEVALDVITVGIGDDSPSLIDAGLAQPSPRQTFTGQIGSAKAIRSTRQWKALILSSRLWSGQKCFALCGPMSVLSSHYNGAKHGSWSGVSWRKWKVYEY